MMSMAGARLFDITFRVRVEASQPELASSSAPRASVWLAICCEVRVAVPSVTRPAVMLAAPARPAGSMAAPARKVIWAVTRGRAVLRATITRRPLGRVRSTGRGRTALRGAATGGGAWRCPSGARAATGPV